MTSHAETYPKFLPFLYLKDYISDNSVSTWCWQMSSQDFLLKFLLITEAKLTNLPRAERWLTRVSCRGNGCCSSSGYECCTNQKYRQYKVRNAISFKGGGVLWERVLRSVSLCGGCWISSSFFFKVAFKAENRRQLWSEILLRSFPLHIILCSLID